MDPIPVDDFAAEQLKLSNSLLDTPEGKAKDVKPLPTTEPEQPAIPRPVPTKKEPALDDFAKEQLALSQRLVTPTVSNNNAQGSYIDQIASLGPDKMDKSHWAMLQSEKDPYQIENISKRMPWALNEAQVRTLAGHHRTKDPSIAHEMSPHKEEGVIWPVIKDLATGAKTLVEKTFSPVRALYDIGGEGMNDWGQAPSAENQAKYAQSLKDPMEALRSSGAAIIETGEDVTNAINRTRAEGATWWDRGLEKIGAITPEEADDKFVRRHAITAYNELFKARNPSEYARLAEYARPVSTGAMESIVSNMTPDVDDILATYSQLPEYADMSRDEALQIKKKQDKEVAQSAISDMVKDLNQNALVDPSLKNFAGLLTPGGNVFSAIELGVGGALKAASALEKQAIRVSLGMTKAEYAAVQAFKEDKALADVAEKAAKLGPIGKASTKVADMVDTGAGKLKEAIEVIPEAWRPYVAGAVGLGGVSKAVDTLVNTEDRMDAAKKWGTRLGYTALALSAPRLLSDYLKGGTQLAGRGFEGAALSGASSKLTKTLLQGTEKIKLSPRWPQVLDAMADFGKYTAETGIRMIPLTLAAGALEDQTAEELQKSYTTGLVYGFGGRWLGLATGKDPGRMKDLQNRMEFDYLKEMQKQSPETRARYESVRSYDNEIERRKNNLAWAESHLQQTVKDVGMDNDFYKEAADQVLQARKHLKKAQEASPEERSEYRRMMGNVFADASAVINGTVKSGTNVNIELLTEDEIKNRLMEAGASKGMTPEFAQMAARQRGGYYSDGVVPLPNGNSVKAFDRDSVVINLDKIRRNQEFSGRSFAYVFQHEVGHALENFQQYRDANQSARDELFGKQHKGPNGEVLAETPGVYSEDDLVENYYETYMGRKTAQQQETWLKQNGLWDWTKNEPNKQEIAEVQKEEIIADLNARGLSGGIKYTANSPIQSVIDWVTAKHDNNKLAQALRDLSGLGEPSPFRSDYTGAHFSPKVQEANRRALQAAADLNGNFKALTKVPKPKIQRADILQNAKLREHYMNGTQYYKEGLMAVVYDKDNNPIHTVLVQSPGAKEGEWRHAVDANGNSTLQQVRGFGTLPSELGDVKAEWTGAPQAPIEDGSIRVPEGGRIAVERKIVLDEKGKPVENERATRKMLNKARAKMIRDALDGTPDLGAPGRMQAVSEDGLTYRGRLTPLQRKAIQDLPEGVIPLSIKEKFLNLSDMIGNDDGTPVIADYANRMDVNGNYVPFSPKLIEFVPIGLHFSKAGNLLVTTISIDGLHDKLNLWRKYMPERLAPWSYDTDAFMRQFMTYLGNWEAGLEAQTSHANLDPNPEMANAKKNIFNDLLNMVDKETRMKNPDRTKLPDVKLTPEEKADGLSSDPNAIVRSRRLDSIASMEASAGEKYRIPYLYAKNNWMAEGAPEPVAPKEEKPVGPIGIGLGAIGGQKDFYSKAGEVLLTKMPERASYDQLKNMLDPARGSGVKPDELKYSGILPFMERVAQEKGQISKQDIQQFLKENYQAKFTERVLDSADESLKTHTVVDMNGSESEAFNSIEEAEAKRDEWIQSDVEQQIEDGFYEPDEIEPGVFVVKDIHGNEINDIYGDRGDSVYSFDPSYSSAQKAQTAIEDAITAETESRILISTNSSDNPNATKWDKYDDGKLVTPGGTNYKETILQMPGTGYESSHFEDIPDYIAHLRSADFVSIDGKEGKIAEEIQSDLNQDARQLDSAGKQIGYRGHTQILEAPTYQDIELKRVNYGDPDFKGQGTDPYWISTDKRTGERIHVHFGDMSEDDALAQAVQYGFYRYQQENFKESQRLPDTPFKKDWPLQLFKRLLRDAVAEGKDWVGWPTGEEQQNRYPGVRKVASKLIYDKNRQRLMAYDLNGEPNFDQEVPETKLSDYIGRGLADRLLNNPELVYESGSGSTVHRLSGDNLEVSEPGLKAFYDLDFNGRPGIVPALVKGYIKQWGAKIEPSEVVTGKNESQWIVKGSPEIPITQIFPSRFKANQAISNSESKDGFPANSLEKKPIWRIDITPEMRESVKRGQPLFMAEGGPDAESHQRELDDFSDRWKAAGVRTSPYIAHGTGDIRPGMVVVPKDKRNQGLGTQVMQDLARIADKQGRRIALTPSTDFGGSSVSRLKDFYSKFGFVENKGKNKDFSTRETMLRPPAEKPAAQDNRKNPGVQFMAADDEENYRYRGTHVAPGAENGAPMHKLTESIYPDDFYTLPFDKVMRYYGSGDDVSDRESLSAIMAARGKPGARVKVYRAVPKYAEAVDPQKAKAIEASIDRYSRLVWLNPRSDWFRQKLDEALEQRPKTIDSINPGDWVTPSRSYAKDHGEGALNGEYKILSKTVPASTLFSEGNSLSEFGYSPKVKAERPKFMAEETEDFEDPYAVPVPTQAELDERKARLPKYTATVDEQDGDPDAHIHIYPEGSDKRAASATVTRDPYDYELLKVVVSGTSPEFKRQGYGDALYREIAKYAQGIGATKLEGSPISSEATRRREKLFKTETGRPDPKGGYMWASSDIPGGVRYMAEDAQDPTEATAKTRMPMSAVEVLHKDSAILPKPTEKRTNAEIATQLADVAERYHGQKITSSNITPEIEQEFVTNGADEAEAALKASGKNAANWYSTAIQAALKVAGVIHNVLTDIKVAMKNPFFSSEADPLEAANFALRLPLAITSQNMTVPLNTRHSEEQFNIFQQTGKFDPSKQYGGKAKSISANLDLANRMIEKLGGLLELKKFVDRQFTVRDLEQAASKITGTKVTIAGRKDDLVNGAAIFGPKIGQGFLQNLMGKFDPVTIDLWMRRTWGRWTGDVVGDGVTGVRLGRMIQAFRDSGKALPASIRNLKTVMRSTGLTEKGRPKKAELTIAENVEDRLETDIDFRQAVERIAKEADAEFQGYYKLMSAPMGEALVKEVRAAMPANPKAPTESELSGLDQVYRKVVKEQGKIADLLNKQFAKLTNEQKKALNQADPSKPIKKDDWIALKHQQDGRVEKLQNPEKNLLKPEWAKSAKVIVSELNPIDIPSDQDRMVISRIVNKIRETLESRGYTVTNADVQAILWYPEKDLWAKLAGKKESNLKQSYDDEFINIAEQRGLGEQAREAARDIRGY